MYLTRKLSFFLSLLIVKLEVQIQQVLFQQLHRVLIVQLVDIVKAKRPMVLHLLIQKRVLIVPLDRHPKQVVLNGKQQPFIILVLQCYCFTNVLFLHLSFFIVNPVKLVLIVILQDKLVNLATWDFIVKLVPMLNHVLVAQLEDINPKQDKHRVCHAFQVHL